jgi:hypothetical protein
VKEIDFALNIGDVLGIFNMSFRTKLSKPKFSIQLKVVKFKKLYISISYKLLT